MGGALGAKIGEGATADVHEWSPGRAIKLFKPGFPQPIVKHEARMTRAVFRAGAAAPELFEEVTIDGRPGLVMARVDGPTLTQAINTGEVCYATAGAILAEALRSLHKIPPPLAMPVLRDYLGHGLPRLRGKLSDRAIAGIAALVDRLPPGDGLCHGDPNPGNVIMSAGGPTLIDWTAAMRAPAAYDLASAQLILTELAPRTADDPERPRSVHAAMHPAYAALAGISPALLAASAQPYLPIVRAHLLMGGAAPVHEVKMVRDLEAEFAD